jgi:TPP-dependent pyruvate/acetoin dehydrogenase alpha subunit
MPSRLTKAQLQEIYYYLCLNRRVDEQLTHLYRQGKVVGGVYSGLGQEAVSVGSAYALEKQDFISPVIRNVGAIILRGFRPRDLFLQYMARRDGPTGGRDANTHFGDLERGVIAPISMLGETVPVMAGIALVARQRRERRVAVAYVGDGATSPGPFHEALNLAAVMKLPLLIIAENNGWAYSTPIAKQMGVQHIAGRAAAYGVRAVTVDGNDVLAVYGATKQAATRLRDGGGPEIVECLTMRMKGHAEHDDARYVPPEILEEWRKKDPLLSFEKHLEEKKALTAEDKAAIAERVQKEIQEDLAFAEASPLPPPQDAARAVWA